MAQRYMMNEEQFEQLRDFYKKLGYNEAQVKRLSESCFGYPVVCESREAYSPDWTFHLKSVPEHSPMDMAYSAYSYQSRGAMMGMASAGVIDMGMTQAMGMGAAPGMGMTQAMGMGKAAAPAAAGAISAPFPGPSAEFSAAETMNPRENEPQSPMDASRAIFSANVNTGSWSYLRNMLNLNKRVDSSFVRIEEILNSYPYKLDPPTGGDLFSVRTEYASCPWNEGEDLMLVEMKAKKADDAVRQNLVLLIDVSGSMMDNWVLTQMSAAAIISKLKSGDTLSIISYSDRTETVVRQIGCADRDNCVDALLSVKGVGGCTNGSEGLQNAYEYLRETYDPAANNRVFIFTDGDFNFGVTSEGGLADFICKKRETGIYLSIVGYGRDNFKDNKMEALAMNGNGNYTFVSNPEDILDNLWDKLVSNLVTIAKDVKISVEFNPLYVSEYRLIGYDARQLTQKEFDDTEKAADGIGSEHNVVALISLKRGAAARQSSSRYVTAQAENNREEFAFIEVHYKSPAGEDLVYTKAVTLAELEGGNTDNIRTASLLAVFGLLVKQSEYSGGASLKLLQKLIDELDPDGVRSGEAPYGHFGIIRKYLSAKGIKQPERRAPAKPVAPPPEGWTCPICGMEAVNGPFCPNCGTKKPQAPAAWDCPVCGAKGNTSSFCPDCGAKKPEAPAAWDCVCGCKGIAGKFCPDCGAKRPEPPAPWDCVCGCKGIAGKFCPNCGSKKPDAPAAWTCPDCGRTGITSRYCTDCGRRRQD